MPEIKLILESGSERSFPAGLLASEILEACDSALARAAVAIRLDGSLLDLSTRLDRGGEVRPVVLSSAEGLEVYRHSTSHVMACAVKELFPGTKVTIGPAIENGFYYDFDKPGGFSSEDVEKIEARMREIIAADERFERTEVSRDEAVRYFADLGERYKVELAEAIPDARVTLYRLRGFTDLCRGPHLPSTGRIQAFKLVSLAGAYWRGDERNPMLQRIYGTAFPSQEELDRHLAHLEEIKRRDHRRLGRELDLFSVHEDVGPGLICWHPRGARVRGVIESFWREEHERAGYDYVYTPHLARAGLWVRSGHMDFYRENMYAPMDVEGQPYLVKPMNCPFHIQIYKSQIRSYRDLPLRLCEMGTVYRYERSGVLHGLLRVRGFTQDDAHIFCTPDQLKPEIAEVLRFVIRMLRTFGFDRYSVYLSTRPEKSVGTDEAWDRATDALRSALEGIGLAYQIDPGEGVFYGPKVDIKINDSLGRAWQCSTVQVDFNLPDRFDVNFAAADGAAHRAIMVHRALLGSLERFFGCLIEHYAGAFPLWLAPEQVRVLTITDRQTEYARSIGEKLRSEGIRAELDLRNEKLGFKIREAEVFKVPYLVVVGDREEREGKVAPRKRGEGPLPSIEIDGLVARLKDEVAIRQ